MICQTKNNMDKLIGSFIPENIISEGWKYIESRSLHKFELAYDVYRKEYSEAQQAKLDGGWLMDGYSYVWQLYIPSFNIFGTWQGVDIIIEEQKSGGFDGTHEIYTIFRGRCDSLELLQQISKLVGIKNYSSVLHWKPSVPIKEDIFITEAKYTLLNKDSKYGLNGTNFKICLNRSFENLDIIYGPDQLPLFVTDDKIIHEVDVNTNHYVHTVCIANNKPDSFCSLKYLQPGTIFSKIPLYDDLKKRD